MANFPTIDFGPYEWATLDKNYIVKWNGKLVALNELQANIAAFGGAVEQELTAALEAAEATRQQAIEDTDAIKNQAADILDATAQIKTDTAQIQTATQTILDDEVIPARNATQEYRDEAATIRDQTQAISESGLPAQAGNGGKSLMTSGVGAYWGSPLPSLAGNARKALLVNATGDGTEWGDASSLPRSERSGNVQLTAAHKGVWIDIVSGTFTQTFAVADELGAGWYCYISNSGSGDISLNPGLAETIDGLEFFTMYPGEVRLVQCDGAKFHSIVINAFFARFVTSGQFIKPPGYKGFGLNLIGAGGGGGSGETFSGGNSSPVYGGTPGVSIFARILQQAVGEITSIVIGSGGPGGAANSMQPGSSGGNTTFGNLITAFGGAGSAYNASGGRSGSTAAGTSASVSQNGSNAPTSSLPVFDALIFNPGEGGNGGRNNNNSTSNPGQAGAASGVSSGMIALGGPCGLSSSSPHGGSGQNAPLGSLISGGGGGGGWGGGGGAGGNGGPGGIPGGAGGGAGIGQTGISGSGGPGARGEVRIWGII